MKRVFYFLHIRKTAGTSLINLLERSGRFLPCPSDCWSELLLLKKEELQEYNLFRGHFFDHLASYLGRELTTFTFLRDPVARAVSEYEHIRRNPKHFFHRRIRRQGSFLTYLRDPVTQPMVRNFQTRTLSAPCDPRAVWDGLPPGQRTEARLEEILYTADTGMSDETALSRAMARLETCASIGITERMEPSLALLGETLGIPILPRIKTLNRNPSPNPVEVTALSADERDCLDEMLRLDQRLYAFAQDMLRQRLEKIGWRETAGRRRKTTSSERIDFIEFHDGAEGCRCLVEGWSAPDKWGVWGRGDRQSLTVQRPGNGFSPLLLRFSVNVILVPGESERRIGVRVNGRDLETWTFAPEHDHGQFEVLIPPEILPQGEMPRVEFLTLSEQRKGAAFGISCVGVLPVAAG